MYKNIVDLLKTINIDSLSEEEIDILLLEVVKEILSLLENKYKTVDKGEQLELPFEEEIDYE